MSKLRVQKADPTIRKYSRNPNKILELFLQVPCRTKSNLLQPEQGNHPTCHLGDTLHSIVEIVGGLD